MRYIVAYASDKKTVDRHSAHNNPLVYLCVSKPYTVNTYIQWCNDTHILRLNMIPNSEVKIRLHFEYFMFEKCLNSAEI